MGKVIFLNGASSSGKTSLAHAIQYKSPDPWLRIGVDTLIDMMPSPYLPSGRKVEEGLNFIPGKNKNGPTLTVQVGSWGKQVFSCLPLLSQLLANHGNNILIDEVILGKNELQAYRKALKDHVVYFVGVFCDLKAMQEREILRRDRSIGLANDQASRIHPNDYVYDITVDTTSRSAFDLADRVLEFVHTHPKPENFLKT